MRGERKSAWAIRLVGGALDQEVGDLAFAGREAGAVALAAAGGGAGEAELAEQGATAGGCRRWRRGG
ncbi:hypothetical protein GCM10020229_23230 [Kitasatospora albolonga]